MSLYTRFDKTLDDYPNLLAAAEPVSGGRHTPWWLVVVLLLAAFVPRATMALRIPSVVTDGVLYIDLAKAMEEGRPRPGAPPSLNTYPLILRTLHRLGLDWETAGTWWGVLMGTLVVLPVFGWTRRQFDDRVAVMATLLCAFHPKLIEWSPEIIRDSTFWVLFMTAVYLLWRAVTEVRPLLFALAGFFICLAALTRIEAVFLGLPFALWTFWRYRALKSHRRRLVLGVAAAVLAFPAFVFFANLLWLHSSAVWAIFRLEPLQRAWVWVSAAGGGGLDRPVALAGRSLTFTQMLHDFVPTITRGLGPVFALLMLGGLWGWRRALLRGEHQAMFWTSMLVLAGIWIQLWYDNLICPRYMLTIVLVSPQFAALGLLGLMNRCERLAQRLGSGETLRAAAAWAPPVLGCLIGLAGAMTVGRGSFAVRQNAMEVGIWVRREMGPPPLIVGPAFWAPIVGYYSDARACHIFRLDCSTADDVQRMVEQLHPTVLLLQADRNMPADQCDRVIAVARATGMVPVEPPLTAQNDANLSVLVRR